MVSKITCDVPSEKLEQFKHFCEDNQIEYEERITDGNEENIDVKSIAENLKAWLVTHSISQSKFAKEVLKKKQSTLSDMLRDQIEPKTLSGKEPWKKARDFLNDEFQKQDLIDSCQEAPRKVKTSHTPKIKPIQWKNSDKTTLDDLYMEYEGKPWSNQVKTVTANSLGCSVEQVTNWFSNHKRKESSGKYTPGQYQPKAKASKVTRHLDLTNN